MTGEEAQKAQVSQLYKHFQDFQSNSIESLALHCYETWSQIPDGLFPQLLQSPGHLPRLTDPL